MVNNPKQLQQRGMSGVSLMFLLIILVIGLIMFFKLFPLYMDNWKVVDALEQLKGEENIIQKMDNEIRTLFLQKLNTKDVKLFNNDDVKQVLTITHRSDQNEIDLVLEYQRTTKFMSNISFLVDFKEQITIP
jgi:hypothetical protein